MRLHTIINETEKYPFYLGGLSSRYKNKACLYEGTLKDAREICSKHWCGGFRSRVFIYDDGLLLEIIHQEGHFQTCRNVGTPNGYPPEHTDKMLELCKTSIVKKPQRKG